MANSVVISRSHLIYGICLPLAVLMGYFLAEPFESGTVAVMVLVLSVLSVPVLMRWHHGLLIFSCNAAIYPFFIPGRPTVWMIAAVISFFFLVLSRSLGRNEDFFRARSVSMSLIFIVIVALATASLTGGIGFGVLGAQNAGGKRYFSIFTGVMLYFAMSTVPIKPKYGSLAVSIFFLSALTGLVGYIAAYGGSTFYFLEQLFPVEDILNEGVATAPDVVSTAITRWGSLSIVATGVWCWLLCRYGVKGVLNLSKPWRLALLSLAAVGNLYSGFRSSVILLLCTFIVLFYLEGLFRTRHFPVLLMVLVLAAISMVPFAQKLPLVVQRTLSFLPLNLDPIVRRAATDSSDWRLEMWQEVLPTVPRYLIKGKGFVINTDDLYLIETNARHEMTSGYEGALQSGDYHSGPLSLIVPFGLFGVAGFLWFLIASVKVLRQNYRYGDPSLRIINRFFLAYFIVRAVFYFLIFGSFYSDLPLFASWIGLSVSMNGAAKPPKPVAEELDEE